MSQRYEDVKLRIFVDDEEFRPISARDMSVDSRIEHDSVKYQGAKTPTSDSSYMGETGSATLERTAGDADLDAAYDRFVEAVKERTAAGRIRMVVSYRDPDGSGGVVAYRYLNCQLNLGMSSGSGQKVTRTLRWTADSRERI